MLIDLKICWLYSVVKWAVASRTNRWRLHRGDSSLLNLLLSTLLQVSQQWWWNGRELKIVCELGQLRNANHVTGWKLEMDSFCFLLQIGKQRGLWVYLPASKNSLLSPVTVWLWCMHCCYHCYPHLKGITTTFPWLRHCSTQFGNGCLYEPPEK